MKHGPIALLDEDTPVVVVATDIHVYDKLVSNIQEVRARGAHVIAIATDGNEDIQHHADDVIYVPKTPAFLQAVLAVMPLQLLAYRIARLRGLNVDQPRNLAKTVTVGRRAGRGDDADARGHDEELALGFASPRAFVRLAARVPDDFAANTVELEAADVDLGRLQRNFYTSSSCGVCGRARSRRWRSRRRGSTATCASRPRSWLSSRSGCEPAQAAFEATGGLHATGLFSADGKLLCVREDVGRHNALDKVVGRAFLDGLLPLSRSLLCVSGRPLLRARPEGRRGGRLPGSSPSGGTVVPRRRARGRPGVTLLRLRPRRLGQRLHRAVARHA